MQIVLIMLFFLIALLENLSAEGPGKATPEEIRLGPQIIHQISVDYKNPRILYAATSHYGILKSEDAGQNWKLINKGLKSYTHRQIVIDPRKTEVLYAGAWGGGMSKSMDGGKSWVEINRGLGDTTVNAVVLHPEDPDEVYVATESGVFRSRNGGSDWEDFNSGLSRSYTESFNALLILPKGPPSIYLGSNEGLYLRVNKSDKWISLKKGPDVNITALAYSPDDHTLYAGTFSSGLLQSKDGGKIWEHVEGTGSSWVRGIVIDPLNPGTLYLALKGEGILKSKDKGMGWESFNAGLPNTSIQSITIDPAERKNLYAGTYDDRIFISHDGGKNWGEPRSVPRYTITEILESLPPDEYLLTTEEIEKLIHSPGLTAYPSVSDDASLSIPPSFIKCNGCHGWTNPLLNLQRTYWRVPSNKRDWEFTVKERMSFRSALTPEEEKAIIQFLEHQEEK